MRALVLLAVAGVMTIGCGSSPAPAATTPTTSGVVVVTVEAKTVKGKDEPVLTNASGMTLYYLTSDTSTAIKCSGQCATFWPPLLLPTGQPAAGLTVSGKLSILNDANGMQVLYNGHPLYAFAKDKTTADANGEGINAFGGTWHVATPDLASS